MAESRIMYELLLRVEKEKDRRFSFKRRPSDEESACKMANLGYFKKNSTYSDSTFEIKIESMRILERACSKSIKKID